MRFYLKNLFTISILYQFNLKQEAVDKRFVIILSQASTSKIIKYS